MNTLEQNTNTAELALWFLVVDCAVRELVRFPSHLSFFPLVIFVFTTDVARYLCLDHIDVGPPPAS